MFMYTPGVNNINTALPSCDTPVLMVDVRSSVVVVAPAVAVARGQEQLRPDGL